MNTKAQLWCALCGPAYIALLAGGLLIAGILPPHAATWSADQVAGLFHQDPFRMRLGLNIAMYASALYIPFSVAVAMQMARIEGRYPVLAWTQMVAAAGTFLAVAIPIMIWEHTAFRIDRSPELTLLMDDLANTFWAGMTTPYWLQPLCISVVGFMDKSAHPLFPRWACYLGLVELVAILPGGTFLFHFTGPLAWDGVFIIVLPFLAWITWFLSTTYFVVKAIKRQALNPNS